MVSSEMRIPPFRLEMVNVRPSTGPFPQLIHHPVMKSVVDIFGKSVPCMEGVKKVKAPTEIRLSVSSYEEPERMPTSVHLQHTERTIRAPSTSEETGTTLSMA
jgi:hypothetical protein